MCLPEPWRRLGGARRAPSGLLASRGPRRAELPGYLHGGGVREGLRIGRGPGDLLSGPASPVVENALQRALLGDTGGFAPVHAALTSFHQTAMVFEHVWAAAGRPRVLLKQRALLGAMGGAAPAAFHAPSVGDVRLAATLVRYDELPELPETLIEG